MSLPPNMNTIWVLKNPDPYTQARVMESTESPGEGWEEMTWEELDAWKASQPAPPPPPPAQEPDWEGFSLALRTENGFTAAFLAAFVADPWSSSAMPSRFDRFVERGDYGPLLSSIVDVLNSLPVEQAAEIGAELLTLAMRCHLPEPFLAALQAAFAG